MKENGPLIKSSLKTLLKRYSRSDAIKGIESSYSNDQVSEIKVSSISIPKCFSKVVLNAQEKEKYKKVIESRDYPPVLVRPKGDHYESIIGLSYVLSAKSNRIKNLSCCIRNYSDEEALIIMASHLRELKNLNVVREAYLSDYLKNNFGYKNKDLCLLFSQSAAQISNILHLLTLDNSVLTLLNDGEISYGHVKAFYRLEKEQISVVVSKILKENLNVRETERLCKNIESDEPITKGLYVTKNKIILEFDDQKELEKTLNRISKLIKRKRIKL